jgi:hypothetical protein
MADKPGDLIQGTLDMPWRSNPCMDTGFPFGSNR